MVGYTDSRSSKGCPNMPLFYSPRVFFINEHNQNPTSQVPSGLQRSDTNQISRVLDLIVGDEKLPTRRNESYAALTEHFHLIFPAQFLIFPNFPEKHKWQDQVIGAWYAQNWAALILHHSLTQYLDNNKKMHTAISLHKKH